MDPVAALVLAEAGALDQPVAVLDDVDGTLTRAAAGTGADVRAWCDDIRQQDLLPPAARRPTMAQALAGARTVLWRLPRAVSAVQDYAETIASHAETDVRVVAGGRVKHLTRAMNDMLARSFVEVRASLGVRKSRVLHARLARPDATVSWPRARQDDRLGIEVVSRGATFNTNRLDAGTGLLIDALGLTGPGDPRGRAVDLACGSGILATLLARQGWDVVATDVSAAACESTELTARANCAVVTVQRARQLDGLRTASVDLIVANPPFHEGAAKDSSVTRLMLEAAPTVLRPGGELWLVFNSHLPYLTWLRDLVGPTSVIARDRHYTVTRSRTRGVS